MTIDPTSFEAQGKPTPEQALQVWREHKGPDGGCSSRKLQELLEQRGFKISYRTLARWIENAMPGARAMAHNNKVRGVKEPISQALLAIPAAELKEADRLRQNDVKQMSPEMDKSAGMRAQIAVQDEANIIDARIKELVQLSNAELDVQEEKSRKILNIVLTEAAARRANVMVLIPKETGSFVEAMTEASKQTLTGGIGQMPKADDPNVIEGEIVDVEAPTPLASKISKFLQDEGMIG